MTEPPADLRARLRAERRALGDEEQAQAAERAAARVAGLTVWETSRSVALYVAADGELDPAPIGRIARQRGAVTFVPVLVDGTLRFAPVDDSTWWRPNRFGIPEPVSGDVVGADTLDLMIVPAVAVDPAGHRLGMGGGWYDRTLGPLGAERPFLVATVHDLAIVESLSPEPWDVPMDVVVTPTRTLRRGTER